MLGLLTCLLLPAARGLSPSAIRELTAPHLAPDVINAFQRLPFGNTNQVFQATTTSGKLYLVRAFGTVDALAFDRPRENEVYGALASAGHAPPLIATLADDAGRIEGWVEGRACSAGDCRNPLVYEQVAQALARLHTFRGVGAGAAVGGEETWAYTTCCQWLSNAEGMLSVGQELEIHDLWLGDSGASTKKAAILERAEALRASLAHVRAQLESFRESIARVDEELLPRCYCHNDLSPSNVHFNCDKETVQIIDFEFGGLGARGRRSGLGTRTGSARSDDSFVQNLELEESIGLVRTVNVVARTTV